MIKKVALFIGICSLLLGGLYFINNRPGQGFETDTDTNTRTNTTTPAKKEFYTPLPQETIQRVHGLTDHVDYIFYEHSFSINTEGDNAKQSLGYFDKQPAPKNNCKPFARLIYLGKGDVLLEAEVYFSQGCSHAAFYENKKLTYGNVLSNSGVQFFTQMLNNVSTKPQ